MAPDWEYGGEFHWPDLIQDCRAPIVPEKTRLFASGRDALGALFEMRIHSRGWRRLHLPGYFCQKVVAAAESIGLPGIRVLRPDDPAAAPYMMFLECDTPALRDHLRTELLAANIYASVIWPIPARGHLIQREAGKLSRRILTIPCDYRYGEEDLCRVAEAVSNALSALRACA